MSARRSIADLSVDLADRAESFCRWYFPEGRKQGNYWQVGDTSGAKGQSLAIRLQAQGGRKAGSWTDYATGQYGDLIDLLHERLGSVTLKETLREARSFLGEAPCPTVPRETQRAERSDSASSKRIARARRLFAAGKPVLGTVAATYLQGRGITRLGPALRYHPRVFLWQGEDDPDPPQRAPALLAKITDNRGQVTGCARTYLDPSTGGLGAIESPKRILGQLHGHPLLVRLTSLRSHRRRRARKHPLGRNSSSGVRSRLLSYRHPSRPLHSAAGRQAYMDRTGQRRSWSQCINEIA